MKQSIFTDLVDVDNLKKMVESTYAASGIPVGIIDAHSGQIYAGAGWQRICTEFHRKNEELQQRCLESDTEIADKIQEGNSFAYKCKNGLWDIGIPIFCLEKHIATIFLGQFFYENEQPDRKFFVSQAKRYDLDLKLYLEALDEVPIFSKKKVETILEYNKSLAKFISNIASNAELLRRESEEKYRRLVDNMPAILYSYSSEKGGFNVYGKSEEILGYKPSYLMAYPFVWQKSIHPEDIQRVKQAIEQFEAGHDFAIEYRIKDRLGKWHWLHDRSIGGHDDSTKGTIEGLALDISEQKQARQALADSEQRLSDIIDFLPDPTWVIDIDGRVIVWNKAMEKITGIEKTDIIGKGDYAYAVPFYGKPRPILIDLVLNRDEQWEKEYIDLKENDGLLIESESFHPDMGDSGLYFAGTASRLYNSKGDIVGAIEIIRNITVAKRTAQDREQLIEELQEAISKIRTLSGLLPICASCKKIRDDKGYWNQIESYIRNHSEADFSHCICPECAKELYPDFDIHGD